MPRAPQLNKKQPKTRRKQMTPKAIAARELGRKVYEARLAGFSYRQIADRMNVDRKEKGLRPYIAKDLWRVGTAYEQTIDRETMDGFRWMHIDRTEQIFSSLQGGIRSGNPRSAEVGLKALERQAALLGLDYANREQELGSQPITIVIGGHPGDLNAQRLLAEHRANGGAALLPPIEGTLLNEAHHGPGGGNGSGEDVLRPPVGVEQAVRPDDQAP
jgi:hypothetical protein